MLDQQRKIGIRRFFFFFKSEIDICCSISCKSLTGSYILGNKPAQIHVNAVLSIKQSRLARDTRFSTRHLDSQPCLISGTLNAGSLRYRTFTTRELVPPIRVETHGLE